MERTRSLSVVPPEGRDRPLSQRSDDELMQLSAGGSEAAFACLVRRHHQTVRAFCARSSGATHADDVAQEAFVAVYRARHTYVPDGRFRAFLFKIAARRSKNALRSVRTRREESEPAIRASTEPDSLDLLLVEERRRKLHALVTELPEAQGTAIMMRFTGGLDFAEVAEAVGCSEPTARTRVHLGLSKLRALCTKRGVR